MLITTRYLLKTLFVAALFVALTLTAVVWLTQSLKILELVANSDAPVWFFVKIVTFSLPRFLEIILPMALVVSVLFTYNKLLMDNELIVLRACGFDHLTLARPALTIAAGMTLLLLVMTTWISPACYAQMHLLRQDVQQQYSSFLLQEGVFNTFGDDMTVYLRTRSPEGVLSGLVIHDARDKTKPPVTVTAKSGRIVTDGVIPSILVYDGIRQQINEQTGALSKLYFSMYTVEIRGAESNTRQRWREPNERTLFELLFPDPENKRDSDQKQAFLAEANHRLVTPFNAISFTLISLCCLLLGPFNRRGQNRRVMMAAALITGAEALHLSLVSFSKIHFETVPLFYISTFLPIVLCGYFLTMRGEQRLMRFLRQWNPLSVLTERTVA